MTVIIEDLHTGTVVPTPVPSLRLRRALGTAAIAGALFTTGVLAIAVFAGDEEPEATRNPNQVLLDRGSVVAVERWPAVNPHASLYEIGSIRAVEHAAG